MKLFLLISVFISVAKGGDLFWGDATEITDNGLFSLQCQHDGKVSFKFNFRFGIENGVFLFSQFLTASQNGIIVRQEWFDSPNQKFVFTKSLSIFQYIFECSFILTIELPHFQKIKNRLGR